MKFFFLFVVIAAADAAIIPQSIWCTESIHCPSIEGSPPYLRGAHCTRWGLIPAEDGPHPCSTVQCANQAICVIAEVFCGSKSCPGQAQCHENPITAVVCKNI